MAAKSTFGLSSLPLTTKAPILAFGTHAYTAKKVDPLSQTSSKSST